MRGRIIDLSYAAAKKIRLDVDGVAPVTVTVVGFEGSPAPAGDHEPIPPGHDADCVWIQVGAFSDLGNARRAVDTARATIARHWPTPSTTPATRACSAPNPPPGGSWGR